MLILIIRLQKNQSAGHLDDNPWRTVHQSPPKNMAPSNMPAAKAKKSFIAVTLVVLNCASFLGHPMPSIETADHEACYQ
jgi:hypothetical protein